MSIDDNNFLKDEIHILLAEHESKNNADENNFDKERIIIYKSNNSEFHTRFEACIEIMEPRVLQKMIRAVNRKELAMAAKYASKKIQSKILANMSKLASTSFIEGMECFPPSYEAQENFVKILSKFTDTGEICSNFNTRLNPILPEILPNFFIGIYELKDFLECRWQPEDYYGLFIDGVSMCSFRELKNSENLLADIWLKNEAEGMGNFQIPDREIKLINYSICPNCEHLFSFKDLIDYYINIKPDKRFKSLINQYREDTRVLCPECNTYFFPSLVIAYYGNLINEVQFLGKIQTVNEIEQFYGNKGRKVLSANKKNILKIYDDKGNMAKAIRIDILLKELCPKPTLIANLLQYTSLNQFSNLIDGSNYQKGDVLYGYTSN